MNRTWERIPTHDEIGQRIKIGDQAVMFSQHDIHFSGKIVQRGGKRWFEIEPGMWIGGIGNQRIMREESK